MANSRAKFVGLLFRLNPAIKNSVDKRNYQKTKKALEEHYCEIDARVDKQKGIMAFHRMFSVTGLALYRALHDEFQDKEVLTQRIHEILWKGPISKMIRFLAFFIRRCRDPFRRYLQILRPNNEWFFPCPPWEKIPVEIEDGIGWHQKKCPLLDFSGMPSRRGSPFGPASFSIESR